MTAFLVAVGVLVLSQGSTAEYTFKNASASHFVQQNWKVLESLYPGIQLAKDLSKPPPTGIWVYVDGSKNRLVFGSRADEVDGVERIMAEFDVRPKRVNLTFKVKRAAWRTDCSGSLNVANNEVVLVGARSLGANFEFRPRINNDGTVTVTFGIATQPENERSGLVFRIVPGRATYQIIDGKGYFITNGRHESKTLAPAIGEVWKPFLVEISVAHVEEK